MFVALELLPNRGERRKRPRGWRTASPPLLRQVRVPSGAAFYVLTASQGRNGIDWSAVRASAGRLAGKLLLPEGLVPPEGSGCRALACKRYRQRLVFNTALRLIGQCVLEPRHLSITLLDSAAHFASDIRDLMPYAASVRVITALPARYAAAERELLEDFGATLLVREPGETIRETGFLLLPEQREGNGIPLVEDAVVIGEKDALRQIRCRFAVSGEGTVLPPAYQPLLPVGIAPALFAEALYEHCGAAALAGLCYAQTYMNGLPLSLDGIAAEIRNAKGNTGHFETVPSVKSSVTQETWTAK